MATTTDYAHESSFIFRMGNSVKEVEFNITGVSGMGVSLGQIDLNWQSTKMKRPGDEVTFGELSLTVLLDEDFNSFTESIEFIKLFKDYEANTTSWDDAFTGILMTTNNRNRFNKTFEFHNCWFQSVSDLTFTSTSTDATPLTFTISVIYDYFSYK